MRKKRRYVYARKLQFKAHTQKNIYIGCGSSFQTYSAFQHVQQRPFGLNDEG